MAELFGKVLKSRLIASSCPATETAKSVLRLADAGIGGAILKSCADYIRGEYSGSRRFLKSEWGYYASSPFEHEILTLDEEIAMLRELRPQTNIALVASFTAKTLDISDWLKPCKMLLNAGADAVQLDFFYMGNLLGERDFSRRFVDLLSQLNSLPIIPKLNINLPASFVMPFLKEAGTEYISLLDSVRVPPECDENGKTPNGIDPKTCSLFGHWMLPLAASYTYTAAKYGLKPISGGGISCVKDVRWLFNTGAEFVQSASFLMKNNTAGVRKLCE